MSSEECTDANDTIFQLKANVKKLEEEIKILKSLKCKVMIDKETQYEVLTLLDEYNAFKDSKKNDYSIADMIRETSESCMSESGYTYDPKTGLYYHTSSGYYYDPANQLFYNPQNHHYYLYDTDTNEYKYHSQANVDELDELKNQLVWSRGFQHKAVAKNNESNDVDDESSLDDNAPCIRLINKRTGDLSIITCNGGSICSDKSKNPIVLIAMSKNDEKTVQLVNIRISYDKSKRRYGIRREPETTLSTDQCMLNETAITQHWQTVDHMNSISIGHHEYSVHIHDDHSTCDWCEPGQVLERIVKETKENELLLSKAHYTNRWKVVNNLKMKYGLKGVRSSFDGSQSIRPKYVDRAKLRRMQEKKDNVENKSCKDTKDNAALKMMKKMGWKPGDSLGKCGDGILDPVESYHRLNERAGIGCGDSLNVSIDADERMIRKMRNKCKTQQRYAELFKK